MDSDTTKGRQTHERILSGLVEGDVDIMVGTQMITKGLDVPEVTLVGVVHADLALGLPDFRAAERTFQLITQVSGRAGRGKFKGKVVVQTYNPEHYSIVCGCQQNFLDFFKQEDEFRKELEYPPYSKIVLLRMSDQDGNQVVKFAKNLRAVINKINEKLKICSSIEILGPSPSPLAKLHGKTRWQIMLKSADPKQMKQLVHALDNYYFKNKNKMAVNFKIDVDPMNFL